MLRKLALSIICLVSVLTVAFVPVWAQEGLELEEPETVIRDSEGIKLQLVRQVQDPNSKEVVFDLVIYSLIESDRVQVTWTVTGASEILSEPISVLSVGENRVYQRQAIVRPRQFGVSTVIARVEAFEAEGTYVSTATATYGSYEDGMIFPSTSEYQLANFLIIIRFVFIVLAVLYAIAFIIVFAYFQYISFIKRDERKY